MCLHPATSTNTDWMLLRRRTRWLLLWVRLPEAHTAVHLSPPAGRYTWLTGIGRGGGGRRKERSVAAATVRRWPGTPGIATATAEQTSGQWRWSGIAHSAPGRCSTQQRTNGGETGSQVGAASVAGQKKQKRNAAKCVWLG